MKLPEIALRNKNFQICIYKLNICIFFNLLNFVFSANECQPGEYLDNVTITCQTCDFGSYNPEPSSRESCFLCPQTMDGYARTTLFKGATNQSECFSVRLSFFLFLIFYWYFLIIY